MAARWTPPAGCRYFTFREGILNEEGDAVISEGDIELMGYYNGLYWVIVPRGSKEDKESDAKYGRGYFIRKQVVHVPRAVASDIHHWSS